MAAARILLHFDLGCDLIDPHSGSRLKCKDLPRDCRRLLQQVLEARPDVLAAKYGRQLPWPEPVKLGKRHTGPFRYLLEDIPDCWPMAGLNGRGDVEDVPRHEAVAAMVDLAGNDCRYRVQQQFSSLDGPRDRREIVTGGAAMKPTSWGSGRKKSMSRLSRWFI